MTEIITAALSLFLSLRPPLPIRRCIEARAARISRRAAEASREHGVPVAIILSVGWLESHLGCDPRSGGSWGSPTDRNHRLRAGGPWHTARDLATSYRVCGSWTGAVARYRCGLCNCTPRVGYGVRDVDRLVYRITAGVGL